MQIVPLNNLDKEENSKQAVETGSRVASGECYPTQAPIPKRLKLVAVDSSFHRWRSHVKTLQHKAVAVLWFQCKCLVTFKWQR